jgi:hypothetical protein
MSDIYSAFDNLTASFEPRIRPAGGSVYLYSWTDQSKANDWRADGYRWKQMGAKSVKTSSGSLKKRYFHVYDGRDTTTSNFTRSVFTRDDVTNAVVVLYTGDESVAAQFPHGNATVTMKNFVRTQPSVLRQIEESAGSPQVVYQQLVTADGPSEPTALPRNATQVRNVMKSARNKTR